MARFLICELTRTDDSATEFDYISGNKWERFKAGRSAR